MASLSNDEKGGKEYGVTFLLPQTLFGIFPSSFAIHDEAFETLGLDGRPIKIMLFRRLLLR